MIIITAQDMFHIEDVERNTHCSDYNRQ